MSDHDHHHDLSAPIVEAAFNKVMQQIYNPESQRIQAGAVMYELGDALRKLAMTNYTNMVAPAELITEPAVLSDGSVLIITRRETKIEGSQLLYVVKLKIEDKPDEYHCYLNTFVIHDARDLTKTQFTAPNEEQFNEIKRQLIAAKLTDSENLILNLIYQKSAPAGIPVRNVSDNSVYIAGSPDDPKMQVAMAPAETPAAVDDQLAAAQDVNTITDVAPTEVKLNIPATPESF